MHLLSGREFPVINIEKGGMRGHFEKASNAGTTGVRLVSLQAGTKLNVVPGKAYAELAGITKEALKACVDETEQKTGVPSFWKMRKTAI